MRLEVSKPASALIGREEHRREMADKKTPVDIRSKAAAKPPTFKALVAKRGDTLASTIEHKPTMTISGCGLQGTGKTLWGLRYLPTPILHLNFDRESTGLFYVKDKDSKELLIPKERQQDIAVIPLGPELFDPSATSWTELTARYARDKMEKAIFEYLPSLPGGTVILDGGAIFNTLVQFIELSEIKRTREAQNKKLFPFDYAMVNSYVSGLLGRLDRANVHFYMTHHLTEDWNADGPNGTFRPQHNSQVPRMLQLELRFWCLCGGILNQDAIDTSKKEGKKVAPVRCRKPLCKSAGHQGSLFHVQISENKLNKQLVGYGQDDLTFEQLFKYTLGVAYKEASK